MSTQGAAGRGPDRSHASARDVASALRDAFEHLARATRACRPVPGAVAPLRLPRGPREAWVAGIGEALAESPALTLHLSPGAITYGDAPVLDGADRAVPEALHAAGMRAITLFAGAPEAELVALAALIATDWSVADAALDLPGAVWRAELAHVHFDLVGGVPEPGLPSLGVSGQGHLDLLDRPAEEPSRKGSLSAEALQTLRQLRETAAPEPASFLDVHPTAGVLPPELVSAVALVRAGTDLDPADLAGVLLAALSRAPTPAGGRQLARELLGVAIELLGGALDPSPVLHGLLNAADAELAPDDATRNAVRAAVEDLAVDPLLRALVARLPAGEPPELRGQLFSLLSLPLSEEAVSALAPHLPQWAVQVLADTVLLREMEDGNTRAERVRARLSADRPGMLAVGLAMAARVEDPRLLEPILSLAAHPRAEVREGVLVALRQQTSKRVRELVVHRLGDAAAGVRVEALRYVVAHRLPEVVPWLEARLQEPDLEGLQEPELRALCIAYARLARDRAEAPLSEIAMGRRRLGHPALARYALHGLRAIGTPRARAALQHVASEVPRLRHEAEGLLAGDGR